MWKTVCPIIVWFLLVVCLAGGATSQTFNRVALKNGGRDAVYIIAYDPTCRITVYRGMLARGSGTAVRVCASNRRLGSLIIYDVYGQSLSYSNIRDGSHVNVRFQYTRSYGEH